MRVWNLAPTALVSLLIAGCGAMKTPVPLPELVPDDVVKRTEWLAYPAEWLAYYRRLIQMTAEEQRREYSTAQASYDATPTDDNRIRLALALLIPEAPWRDDAQVLKLLVADASLQPEKQSPQRDFALLLDRLVGERLRLLREENRKLEVVQQKMTALREEHRKVEMLKQKLETMDEECRKVEALQKKLEGLREIDRDLRKRPARRSTP